MPQPTSKARPVITALFVDHQTPAQVAARYGVHRAWVYKLKARYQAEGETALGSHSRRPETHDRTRHDRVDKAGSVTLRHNSRPHHIGVGRTHAGTCVILLVQDLQIRIVNAVTGELVRELLLDPSRDYQPTGTPIGPTRRTPK
ncbi:MAG: integrase catalytic subunit [Nocardioides sp.]|jgi:hypothetical protein|nr:integrase catalytic subunit [Nocardioides sp.]